ncbi:restriction endonuclease subunit S domain-containing protein [Helicobacter salomonis]|uniref:restriction endonuclease subunit S n=1 Tax=Helicobacter salomonis TaxID=56878 RepID=UPI001F3A04E1|nr:restriction endonuclease subunit S [Helicobacter salomonis]
MPISFYEALKIPLPPLQEQEQIMGVIAKIEQERTILENTMKSLKRQWEVILKNIWT